MNNQKQLIIHCGFHKTASSSIQHTLGNNREKLKKLGYYYPDMLIEGHRFYNQSIPLFGFFTKYPEDFQHYKMLNDFDPDQINQQIDNILKKDIINHDRVLFSDEFISSLDEEELIELKNKFDLMGFKIRVITFVRDPSNLVTSQIQQRIPNGSIQAQLDKLNKNKKSYLKIRTLIDVFGTSVEFHCFEKACQFPNGPVAYFLNLLDIQKQNSIKLKIVNESRSSQAVRLIDYIHNNSSELMKNRRDFFPLLAIKGEKFVLTGREFSQIENVVADEREMILALLGEKFFMPINYSTSERELTWNTEQIDTVIFILNELKKHIAIPVYQYFYQWEIITQQTYPMDLICYLQG